MEDTLREPYLSSYKGIVNSLNPCSNGRYSQSMKQFDFIDLAARLNPCSNGRYSQSLSKGAYKTVAGCLNPCSNGRYSQRWKSFQI